MFRTKSIHFQVINLLRRQISPEVPKPAQSRCKSIMTWDSLMAKKASRSRSTPQLLSKRHNIVDGGEGTYKPSPFEQKILVWTKTYPAVADIPERISRGQMKKSLDKFRVRCSIWMVGFTFVFAALMALMGRKARNEGQSVTSIALAKREKGE
ncbi:protein FAM162A [Aplysia californica]|uniref:Protein FAM162A n=1 Tax=Aplysia californica TaxID=6500 RepID=A0ABM0JPR6_APLCA|nr:protein FAM162A [Aplysia californica]